jgi:MFS superfamily sulfate permease-like transporter
LLNLIFQANHPPVYAVGRVPGTDIYRPMVDHPEYETVPGLLILRTEGRLYFASAPRALEKMRALILEQDPQVVALECSAIPDFEYTALQRLATGEEKLRDVGIELWLAGLNPVPLGTIQRSSLRESLGDELIFLDVIDAVDAYEQRYE